VKRDPRLRRSSEQRDPAHGGKYGRRPRYRATQTRSDAVARIARALHLPPAILTGPSPTTAFGEMHDAFIRDAALHGAVYIDGHTGQRIPPDEIR
jgi:dsRNA-specific ribonuclease